MFGNDASEPVREDSPLRLELLQVLTFQGWQMVLDVMSHTLFVQQFNGYAQSKLVAELLVHKAREHGLVATVFRPSKFK